MHSGDLMLVADEAHFLWPVGRLRHCVPGRVNWINTALANFDVPVALIITPQFYVAQKAVERQTGWNSAQFIGRIGHIESLPENLRPADLAAVARAIFPAGGPKAIATLASYAAVSKKHLASIDAVVKRARWLAARDGRPEATGADIDAALRDCVIPGDAALAVALRQAGRGGRAETPPAGRAEFAGDFSRGMQPASPLGRT